MPTRLRTRPPAHGDTQPARPPSPHSLLLQILLEPQDVAASLARPPRWLKHLLESPLTHKAFAPPCQLRTRNPCWFGSTPPPSISRPTSLGPPVSRLRPKRHTHVLRQTPHPSPQAAGGKGPSKPCWAPAVSHCLLTPPGPSLVTANAGTGRCQDRLSATALGRVAKGPEHPLCCALSWSGRGPRPPGRCCWPRSPGGCTSRSSAGSRCSGRPCGSCGEGVGRESR